MLIHTTGSGDGSVWVVLALLGITLVGFVVVVIIKVNEAKKNQRSALPEPPAFPQPPQNLPPPPPPVQQNWDPGYPPQQQAPPGQPARRW
jgi:hypothetical protein